MMAFSDVDQGFVQLILFIVAATGAVVASLWMGMALWTWRDIRARSNDTLAQVAATLIVVTLFVFGLIIYLMLRPRETLAEAYERSLEEEALLQGIEEKPACPGCGRPSNTAWQVCPFCHTRLKKPCLQCGQLLELPWNLCPFCATPQAASGEGRGRVRARQRPAAERNTAYEASYDAERDPRRAPDRPAGAPRPAPLEFVEGMESEDI